MKLHRKYLLVLGAVALLGIGLTQNVWLQAFAKGALGGALAVVWIIRKPLPRRSWPFLVVGPALGAGLAAALEVGWISPILAVIVLLVGLTGIVVVARRTGIFQDTRRRRESVR